jgi:hypothetical protein
LGSGALVESFARHLMTAIDAWQDGGFGEVAKSYLPRLASAPASGGEKRTGIRREIDENGDLIEKRMGTTEVMRHSLVGALRTASWLDPETGGPRQ